MESRAAAIVQVARPIAVAAFLSAVALTLRCTPDRSRPSPNDAATGILAGVMPNVVPRAWVVEPPALRDAEDWPRGMVIKPPSTNDRIAVELAGPLDSLAARLDSLLSALLAPWSATAS